MLLAIGFLICIGTAEAVTVFVDALGGIIFYGLILLASLAYPALKHNSPPSRLVLSLALVPLVRIISLSMPITGIPQVWWFPMMYIPLLLASIVLCINLDFGFRQIGFNFHALPANLMVGASGLVLGLAEYYILKPEPMVEELTWQAVWLPALVLLLTTGLVEELMFRGIIQKTAIEMYGKWGILYVGLVFAILHMGYFSWIDVAFVLAAGVYFGWVVYRTGSLLGVVVAHGLTNIVLFILAPMLLG